MSSLKTRALFKHVSKMKDRIEQAIQKKEFYEAQQIYQTLGSRLLAQKETQEAINIYSDGVIKLLQNDKIASAGELAKLLLTALKKTNNVNQDNIDLLMNIFNSFPSTNDKLSYDIRVNLMNDAIKWTSTSELYPYGYIELHILLARLCRDQMPVELANTLIQWTLRGFKSEYDLFLTRIILQYLMTGSDKINSCNIVMKLYSEQIDIKESPLYNFLIMLLECISINSQALFNMLRDNYEKSLSRDASLSQLLDKLGQIYFNITPTSATGMIESAMKDLFESKE